MDFARFENDPVGLLVLRAERVAYVNPAFCAHLRAPASELLGLRFDAMVVPEQVDRVVDRHHRRLRGEAVPSEYETEILRRDGTRVHARLEVALDGEHTVVRVHDLTATLAHRDRLLELSRIGVALQAERREDAIFGLMCHRLLGVGVASALFMRRGDTVEVAIVGAEPHLLEGLEAAFGSTPVGTAGPLVPLFDLAWREGAAFSDDAVGGMGAFFDPRFDAEARRMAHEGRLDRVALVRVDVGGGQALLGLACDWLREHDLPIVRLFGAQVSAALAASRVIADLSRKNRELAALNRLAALARTESRLETLFTEGLAEIVESCECVGGGIYLLDHERQEVVLQPGSAFRAPLPPSAARIPLSRPDSLTTQVVRQGVPIVRRVERHQEPLRDLLDTLGARLVAGVPLMARASVVGVLVLGYDRVLELQTSEVEVVQAMASHFGAAVESNRLLNSLRARLAELMLMQEVGRALAASLDPDEVLAAGIRNLTRTADATDGFLLLVDAAGAALDVRAVSGERRELLGQSFPLGVSPPTLAARAFISRQTIAVDDALKDARVNGELRSRVDARAYLSIPLVVRGRAIGVALVADRRGPHAFSAAEVERADAIANQIAVAVDNARLYDDLKKSYAELARTQAQLVERERLAAIGELAAVVAHEVRNPLNVIFNSLGALRRQLKLDGNGQMLFDIVGEESERLNRIVGDLLDYARPKVPALRPEPLERLLDEAVAAVVDVGDRRVRVERLIDESLPPVAVDARLLRQAVLNLAQNAVQAMPHGGTLTVRAALEGGAAERVVRIDVADTGPGIKPEHRARIFEPFFTTKSTGTGLGLAVVKRIVDGHGGAIAVASEPGAGTTFTIRLPLMLAQDEGLPA